MNTEQVERIVRIALTSRLIARLDGDRIHFSPENPVDPNAPPYFVSGTATECLSFLHGWQSHEYDLALRRLARQVREEMHVLESRRAGE